MKKRRGDVETRRRGDKKPRAVSTPPRLHVSTSDVPLVAVIMGSTSDWETMRHADEVLKRFGVPHECLVVSAHRTPRWMAEFASEAEGRSEEHTSELQSRSDLVCRLLLEKKKKAQTLLHSVCVVREDRDTVCGA